MEEEKKKCGIDGKGVVMGTSLVLAALVLGIMMVCTVSKLKSFDNTVKVRGLCERVVDADRVTFRINYNEKSNSLEDLRSNIGKHNDEIIGLLKSAGISDDEINVSNPSVEDLYSYSYREISKIAYRYSATQYINVFTNKMDVVRTLQKSLEADMLKRDVLVNGYADYEFMGLNTIKPSMIAESLENARAAADEFAKNSKSDIGQMKTASQGVFEINDLDENTPQKKTVRVVSTVEYYLK